MKGLHLKPVCSDVTCGILKLVSVCSRRADIVVMLLACAGVDRRQCVAEL